MKRWKPLASRRSPSWAFMERFEVPDYDTDGNYLIRWRLIQTPWFGIMLHRFEGPDPRRTLHDHPWPFVSIVLRGGYIERRLDPVTMTVDETRLVRRANVARTGAAHAIVRLLRCPTWTLVFTGARRRTWGYWEPLDGESWSWTEFDKHPHNAEFIRALAARKARA